MKPPRAYARGILHFFGAIRRSTLLRSPSFGGSPLRIHLWTYVHGLLRRRIKKMLPFPTGQQRPALLLELHVGQGGATHFSVISRQEARFREPPHLEQPNK